MSQAVTVVTQAKHIDKALFACTTLPFTHYTWENAGGRGESNRRLFYTHLGQSTWRGVGYAVLDFSSVIGTMKQTFLISHPKNIHILFIKVKILL